MSREITIQSQTTMGPTTTSNALAQMKMGSFQIRGKKKRLDVQAKKSKSKENGFHIEH